jgi:hypothetical protein
MPSKLIVLATVSGLALTTAWAQSPAPTGTAKPEPAAAQNMPAKANFVSKQSPDQLVMSKFKGTNVIGPNDEKIGDVTDILFEKNGNIVAYVIGVGGFLGIGSKDVALTPASFQLVKEDDGATMKLKLAMTKDELKQAPSFEYYSPPSRTSTTAPARPRPAPATQ